MRAGWILAVTPSFLKRAGDDSAGNVDIRECGRPGCLAEASASSVPLAAFSAEAGAAESVGTLGADRPGNNSGHLFPARAQSCILDTDAVPTKKSGEGPRFVADRSRHSWGIAWLPGPFPAEQQEMGIQPLCTAPLILSPTFRRNRSGCDGRGPYSQPAPAQNPRPHR